MRRLGLIVRSDFGGGLANQTYEMWRHLEPDVTLVMMMGDKRRPGSVEEPTRYGTDAYATRYEAPDTATMVEFLSKIDVLLSVETFYVPFLVIAAADAGIERVLYTNPELLGAADPAEVADRYCYAADWVHPFPQPGTVLPWPCSVDREPRQEINWPPRFVHVGAPAMLDRNGTKVVAQAALHVKSELELVIYGSMLDGEYVPPGTKAQVTYAAPVEDLWDLYADADCLVLPRRYGCLSLPMLEAAAVGVPTLTTHLAPQAGWFERWAPWLLIHPGDPRPAIMKGGIVDVHQPMAGTLAIYMDRLAGRGDVLDSLREETRVWAEARSWEKLLPAWEAIVR